MRGRWDRALIGGGGGGGIDGEGSVVAMSGWLEREPTMEGEKEMWGLSQWKKREKCVSISSVHHCLCMDFQCSGLFFFCYLHLLPHIFLGFKHQVPGRRRQSGPQWWPPGRLWGQFIWTLKIGPDCDSLVGSLVVFMQLWTSGMEKDWGSYFCTF